MYLVPFSGGIDSTVCLYWADKRYNIEANYLDYGIDANKVEGEYAKRICRRNNVDFNSIRLSHLDEDMPDTQAPIGSLVMHSLSIYYSSSKNMEGHIYPAHQWDSATHPEDPSLKQYSRRYLDDLENLVTTALDLDYNIITPFLDMGKGNIILLGKKLGVDFSATWSCSAPQGDMHCGTCTACIERKVAFSRAGLQDPTPYSDYSEQNMGDLFRNKFSYLEPDTGNLVSPPL